MIKTYHPSGKHSSSEWLHEEEWLDFNMMQSGHGSGRSTPTWEMIAHDYALKPTKPVLDGEPNYEDHPVDPWPTWNPESVLPRRGCAPPITDQSLRRLRCDLRPPHDVAV